MTLADRPLIAVTAALYLVVVSAIGLWSLRRTRDGRDFFLAGQRIGLWVTALATMSAAFSGFVFLGGPGLTYRMGLGSLMIVLPLGFTGGLLVRVVGVRLRELAGEREILSVPDAFEARFGSRVVTGLAALAVLAGSVAYLGMQIQALGVLLQAVFGGTSLELAMAIGLVVLVAYSVAGGMVAGVYTDVVQGVLMMGTALLVFVQAVAVAGGWQRMVDSVARSPEFGPGFLEPLGGGGVMTVFGFFFVFGVGVLGQPQMLHKFYMISDVAKLRWFPLILSGSQAVCVLLWLGVGLAVPALVAQGRLAPPGRPDDAATDFLIGFSPDVLAGLAVAGVLAAIMSTADSFLNIGAAALVRDLPRVLGRPRPDPLVAGRLAVLVLAGVAALFALVRGDLIALLGTFAFGTFAAALAPTLAVGLHWERIGPSAAAASISTGLVVQLVLGLWEPGWLPEGVLPSAVALAASFCVLFAVAVWSGPPGRHVGRARESLVE
jgi:Na+/proline symporter